MKLDTNRMRDLLIDLRHLTGDKRVEAMEEVVAMLDLHQVVDVLEAALWASQTGEVGALHVLARKFE